MISHDEYKCIDIKSGHQPESGALLALMQHVDRQAKLSLLHIRIGDMYLVVGERKTFLTSTNDYAPKKPIALWSPHVKR